MSEHVEFTPKGLILHKWNRTRNKYLHKRPKKLTVCTHLRSRCEIAEGTTLLDIFNTVDRYKFLKLVISQYSWCRSIDEFHAQAREPMREEEDKDPLTHIEIRHAVSSHKYSEKKKQIGGMRERNVVIDFDCEPDFIGIGPDPAPNSESGTIQYSISYTPMWRLADLPVKLVKEFDVYSPYEGGKKPELLMKSKREFTLLEVLDAIYWDISFMGGPAENADFINRMDNTLKELDSLKESGEIKPESEI